jgi:hypothetical protein
VGSENTTGSYANSICKVIAVLENKFRLSARFILILKSVERLLRFARNDTALITAALSLRGAVGDEAISKLMKRQQGPPIGKNF